MVYSNQSFLAFGFINFWYLVSISVEELIGVKDSSIKVMKGKTLQITSQCSWNQNKSDWNVLFVLRERGGKESICTRIWAILVSSAKFTPVEKYWWRVYHSIEFE